MYNPKLRDVPIAVCGDPEARHGIVLAKNYLAKKFGVQTGDPLWMAKQKCRDITFVPPHYDKYLRFSQLAKEIYQSYSDKVESFGLDECWIDVSGSTRLFGDGKAIANEIRDKVKFELGITVSIGVSFNKIFAKLGSDMKKPDATTVITEDDFRDKVWCLPVNDLLYVGRSTLAKLKRYAIHTIGDLANTDVNFLQHCLGKNGIMLWQFANGLDTSPVSNIGAKSFIKSVGNSTTTPRDLESDEDVKITLYALSESVAARLREYSFICSTVQITVRDNGLNSYQRQGKLAIPCSNAIDIFEVAFKLYKKHHISGMPVRSLGVRACNLFVEEDVQLSFIPEIARIQKTSELERAVDSIRNRYGYFAVQRGLMLTDRGLSNLNAKDDHIIHPISFLGG